MRRVICRRRTDLLTQGKILGYLINADSHSEQARNLYFADNLGVGMLRLRTSFAVANLVLCLA
jgi:hypothetical protein